MRNRQPKTPRVYFQIRSVLLFVKKLKLELEAPVTDPAGEATSVRNTIQAGRRYNNKLLLLHLWLDEFWLCQSVVFSYLRLLVRDGAAVRSLPFTCANSRAL